MHRLAVFAAAIVFVAPEVSVGQTHVSGSALGTSVSVAGSEIEQLRQGDTGEHEATEGTPDDAFDETTQGGAVPDNPAVAVAASASRTRGRADGTSTFVNSAAGEAVAVVLPGASPLLEAVSAGAVARIGCGVFFPRSGLETLIIAGQSLDIPGEVPPNTMINTPIGTITINRQIVDLDDATNSVFLDVTALHVDLIPEDGIEVILSNAVANASNLPPECSVIPRPVLVNSAKSGELVRDGGETGVAEVGDRITYTVHAENSGTVAQEGVTIVDRLPRELTVDEATITLAGVPATYEIGPCPVTFAFCSNEPSSECLIVDVGDLGPDESVDLVFEADVNDALRGDVCNAARIGPAERVHVIDGSDEGLGGGVIGEPLVTAGSGGCDATGSGGIADAWWLALIPVWVLARRTRLPSRLV